MPLIEVNRFKPYSEEELQTLRTQEVGRFTPYSEVELQKLRTPADPTKTTTTTKYTAVSSSTGQTAAPVASEATSGTTAAAAPAQTKAQALREQVKQLESQRKAETDKLSANGWAAKLVDSLVSGAQKEKLSPEYNADVVKNIDSQITNTKKQLYYAENDEAFSALPASLQQDVLDYTSRHAASVWLKNMAGADKSMSGDAQYLLKDGKYHTVDEIRQLASELKASDYSDLVDKLEAAGVEDSKGIVEYIQLRQGQEYAEKDNADQRKAAQEFPVLTSAMTVLASPFQIGGAIDAGKTALINTITGEERPLDLSQDGYLASRFRSNTREQVSEGINNPVGSFLYQTGMSMADFLATAPLNMVPGGSLANGLIMGSGAATDTVIDVTNRGGTASQAAFSGVVAGIAEAAFEKFSLDAFISPKSVGSVKTFIVNILNGAGIEGGEELATEIVNIVADQAIMGDKSNYSLRVQGYVQSGQSREQAEKSARLDLAKQVGLAFAGGALSGGLIHSVQNGADYIGNRHLGNRVMQNGELEDAVRDGFDSAVDSPAYQTAVNIYEQMQKGETPSAAQVGAMVADTRTQDTNRVAEQAGQTRAASQEKAADESGYSVPQSSPVTNASASVPSNQPAGDSTAVSDGGVTMDTPQTNDGLRGRTEAPAATRAAVPADVEAAAAQYSQDTAAVFVSGYTGQLPLETYQTTFDSLYTQGAAGVSFQTAMRSTGENGQRMGLGSAYLAYRAGADEAATLQSRTNRGTMGTKGGADHDYRRFIRQYREEAAGAGDGRRAEEMGRIRQTNGEHDAGRESASSARIRRPAEGSSQRQTEGYGGQIKHTLANGNSISYRLASGIVPGSEVEKAIRDLQSRGVRTVVTDGPYTIHQNEREIIRSEAVTAPDGTIYISNDAKLPGEEIASHEFVHVLKYKNSPLYDDFYEVLRSQVDWGSATYKDVATQINDAYYDGRLDIKSLDSVADIFTELTAYLHQFIQNDPAHAQQTFAAAFRDWDAVVAASHALEAEYKQYQPSSNDDDSVKADRFEVGEDQWSAENRNANADENAAMKSVTEITQKIRDSFGIPISTGRFRQSAYGIYKNRQEAIRTKVSDALPVISHELGHHFDKQYQLTKSPAIAEAIRVLQQERPDFANAYSQRELPGEAVAEFVRTYLTDRTLAKSKYPGFYSAFVNSLKKSDLKKLDSIGDDINRYMYGDLRERAKANVLTREKSDKIQKSKKGLRARWLQARELFSDAAAKVELFGKDAHDRFWMSKDVDVMIEQIISGDYMTNINGEIVEDLNGAMGSLATVLADIPASLREEFDLYLTYRHALEFLANDKRVFADDRLNNPDFIRKEIADMDEQYPEFTSTASELYHWQSVFMRTWLVDTGIMTEDTFELLQSKYPNYVPFYRSVEKGTTGAKRSVANQNSPIMRAKGSGRAILSPVENICVNIDKYVKTADRNAVMQELARALQQDDGLGYLMEAVPPSQIPKSVSTESVRQTLRNALRDTNPDSDTDITAVIDQALGTEITEWVVNPKQGADIVWMIEDGKKKYFQIHDSGLLAALTNLTPYQANGVFSVLTTASRSFKALNTGANPIWAAQSNAVRDLYTTWMYGSENNPFKFLGQYMKAIVDTVQGIRGKEGRYAEYKRAGGGNSAPISNPKQMKSLVQDLYKNDRSAFRKVLENPIRILEGIETFSDIIETAPRLAEYTRQRKKGADLRKAVLAADEVSVNFKRKGQMSPHLDALYPYFNASVQGLSKMTRFAKNNPGIFAVKQITSALLLFALVVGWNRLIMDDEDEYEKLSDYMKNNYYCLSVGDGHFIRIPKAKELSVLESAMERAYEGLALKNDVAISDFINYTVLQFLPPGVPTPENPLAPVSDLIGIGTVVDLAANENFSGSPIVPTQYQDLEPYAQYNDQTSWIAKAIGRAMNLSPMQIDYIINDNLGILGSINKALGAADRDWTLGIVNKATADNAYSTDVFNRFYDRLDELEVASNTNPDDGKALGEYKLYQSMQSVVSQLNKYGRESEGEERAYKIAARDYVQAFQSGQAGEVDERLVSLYERTKDKAVFPYATFSSSISSNGKTVTLSPSQFLDYVDEYEMETSRLYDIILGANVSDDLKVAMLEKAKSEVSASLKSKYVGSDKKLESNVFTAESNGVPVSTYFEFAARAKDIKADKDAKGETINGSRKKKIEALLKEMGVTSQQRQVLLALEGYGSERQRERILGGDSGAGTGNSAGASGGIRVQESAIDQLLKGALS